MSLPSFLDLDRSPPAPQMPSAPASSIPATIGYGAPPTFGSEREQDDYRVECSAAADAQTSDFVVRPRCHVTTPAAVRLGPNDAVDLAAVGGDQRALKGLVKLGVVSHVAGAGLRRTRPEASRFRMSEHLIGSVLGAGVSPSAGMYVSPADFRTAPAVEAVEAAPAHLDPSLGIIVPARAARPAQPAVTGETIIVDLCLAGLCTDLQGEHLPDRARVSRNVQRGLLRPAALVGRFRPATPEAEPAAASAPAQAKAAQGGGARRAG